MNKAELVAAVGKEAGVSQEVTNDVISALTTVITKSLAEGESVSLNGFGIFETKNYAERKSRNVRTQEEIVIPATRKPVFKASKVLKQACANK